MKTDLKLNYRVIGVGYPVVFLHGFLECNSMWESIIPKLNGIKAILVELPGHGESPSYPLEERMTLRNISISVRGILESLDIQNYDIVGHSLGGYVALDMKKLDKLNSIEKVVLLNSHPWSDSELKKKERTRIVNIVEHNKSLFLNEAIPNLFRDPVKFKKEVQDQLGEATKMSKEGIIQSLVAMRDRENSLGVMDDLAEKCLVIQGKHDHLIPFIEMRVLAEKLGNSYYLVEEAGHMAHFESESEVVEKINSFI